MRTSVAARSLIAAALAACSSPSATTSSRGAGAPAPASGHVHAHGAASGQGSGSGGAGAVAPAAGAATAIGGACTPDREHLQSTCSEGALCAPLPGGYCTAACGTTTCPGGSACVPT